jgi:hypothetical protein
LQFSQNGAMFSSMTPDERQIVCKLVADVFAEEREALSKVITDLVERLLAERDRGLEQQFAKLQRFIDEMQVLVKRLRQIDSALHDAPVVDMKIN